jgi:hypothetical protein
LVSKRHRWLGESLDVIRKCKCCEPRVVEVKCPFNGKDPDPKSAFLSESVVAHAMLLVYNGKFKFSTTTSLSVFYF